MRPMATKNVIPFIDIMLVLLTIVLTTATFVAQGRIPVSLPESKARAESTDPSRVLEITVQKDGGLFFENRPVSVDQLAQQLDRHREDARFLLRVDEQAAFQHFVGVIDLLHLRKLHRVSIVTRSSPG